MRRRIKGMIHKRRKVSLTRKRRKTGKSRYSKRSHKRKMMGGMQTEANGRPVTHTHPQPWFQKAVPDPAEVQNHREEKGKEILAELRETIKEYHDIIMIDPAPNTLDKYQTMFKELHTCYFEKHRPLKDILRNAKMEGLY